MLSDLGANTLLLHPDTWVHSKPTPNRLRLLRDYVGNGGGLLMFGGYYSFQGINGGARYHKTPVEDVLPVTCLPVDDRVEVPEGYAPVVVGPQNHPILKGLGKDWPILLGFNEVTVKDGAEVLATVSSDYRSLPLLVTGKYGKGRTVAWTSDVGPHWLPPGFIAWNRPKMPISLPNAPCTVPAATSAARRTTAGVQARSRNPRAAIEHASHRAPSHSARGNRRAMTSRRS